MVTVARYAAAVADRCGPAADEGRETGTGSGRGGGLAGFAGEDGLAERAEGIRARVERVRHQLAGFRLECQLRVYVAVELRPLSVSGSRLRIQRRGIILHSCNRILRVASDSH